MSCIKDALCTAPCSSASAFTGCSRELSNFLATRFDMDAHAERLPFLLRRIPCPFWQAQYPVLPQQDHVGLASHIKVLIPLSRVFSNRAIQ